jgi:hypothetical protein
MALAPSIFTEMIAPFELEPPIPPVDCGVEPEPEPDGVVVFVEFAAN